MINRNTIGPRFKMQSTAMTTSNSSPVSSSNDRCSGKISVGEMAHLFKKKNDCHVDESNILQHSAFHLAYQLITDATYLVPFRVMKRFSKGLYQPDCDHEQNFLVEHVACGMESGDMITAGWARKVITGRGVLGNGIGYINRDGAGRATEIIPLDDEKVFLWHEDLAKPIRQSNGRIIKRQKFYCIMGERGLIKMRPENVYHIRNMACGGNPDWSPRLVDFAADTLGTGLAAARSVKKFFVNGMQVNGILMIPGHLKWADENEKQEVVKKFAEAYANADNAGKTLVLEEGWEFMKTSADNNQAQLVELRKMSAGDAGRLTRVPSGLIGGDEAYSYDTQGQITMRLRSQCLHYWWRQHEDQYNLKVLSTQDFKTGNYKVQADPDDSSLLTMVEKMQVFGPLHDRSLASDAVVKNQFNLPINPGDEDRFSNETAAAPRLPALTQEVEEDAPETESENEPNALVVAQALAVAKRDIQAGMKRVQRELLEASNSGKNLFKYYDRREKIVETFKAKVFESVALCNSLGCCVAFEPQPQHIIEQVEKAIELPESEAILAARKIAEQEIIFEGENE